MTVRRHGVVVVGGSVGGVTVAGALRERGYDGQVTVVSAEQGPAYARPPLSKGLLTGTETGESVRLPPLPDDVAVRYGVAATGLDLARRRVSLSDGDQLAYQALVIATGSRARLLGDAERENVLRTLGDAVRLRERLADARSVLVVGGGFLGMEIASAARMLGKSVTVTDMRTPMLSALGPFLAHLFTEAAREYGVRVLVAPGGVRLLSDGDRLAGVDAGEAGRLEADLVVSAVGDEPETGWLAGSGIRLSGGAVVVDERHRAVDTAGNVFAIGDVAAFPTARGLARKPHWDTAVSQARAVAAILADEEADGEQAGRAPAGPQAPFLWTDAFGLSARMVGDLPPIGPPAVVHGSLAGRSVVLHWTGPEAQAAVAVNYKLPLARLRLLVTPPG